MTAGRSSLFFEHFCLKESGAYTLFCDKPVSFDAFFGMSVDEATSSRNKACNENKRLRKGWEVWTKYQSLFPSDQFLLKAARLDQDRTEIILINKKDFLKTISENINDFKSIINESITAALLLERYENSEISLFDLLNRHHGLLGTLLGFGRNNAWHYHERNKMTDDSCQLTHYSYSEFNPHVRRKSNEAVILTGAFSSITHRKCYKFLYLPAFVVDAGSSETQVLQRKYLNQRREIHDYYGHGDFLEIRLEFCLDLPLTK